MPGSVVGQRVYQRSKTLIPPYGLLVRPWVANAIKGDLNWGELNHPSDMPGTKALM